jgi:riboflavin kinase/FMN adenylyltransferase
LGHQAVFQALRAKAAAAGAAAGILTFGNHPRTVLSGQAPGLLTNVEYRLRLFSQIDVSFVWVLRFTPELSRLTAREFMEKYLAQRLHTRGLVLGFDGRIGCDRQHAEAPELRQIAAQLGISLQQVPPTPAADGRPITSTRIRSAIREGRLAEAAAMLGRPFALYGRVVVGDGLGRKLGRPTANLALGEEVEPPHGVYAAWALFDERRIPAIVNVGFRPTVVAGRQPARPVVEAHLLDFSENLYDRSLELQLAAKIRDEKRFSNPPELCAAIQQDEEFARAVLNGMEKKSGGVSCP